MTEIAQNLLLRSAPDAARRAVLEAAETVHLDFGEEVIEPKQPIRFVDFPETGVWSIVSVKDEVVSEVATVGNEGLIGVSLLLGANTIQEKVFCQVPGRALQLDAREFLRIVEEHPTLGDLCKRYSLALFNQVASNVGCNRTHAVDERFARWLLMTSDRCNSPEFALTQEFLSQMLGVSRTSVNAVAGSLSKAELITYVRGKIKILNRLGLEAASCPCYFEMRDYYARVVTGDSV